MDSKKRIFFVLASSLIVFTAASLTSASEGDGIIEPGENKVEELRKAAQNFMADLISFPIQKPTVITAGFHE